MSDVQFTAITAKLDALVTGQDALRQDVEALKTGQEEIQLHLIRVDKRLDKLEVGQELLVDQVKQIAEGHGATQAAIARSTEAVIAHIDKRIDPLEDAVRAHFGAR